MLLSRGNNPELNVSAGLETAMDGTYLECPF
jgi:hypothetical protein